ncbi:MAG: DeoR/GlpR transcriptional regulator, partial [Cellulomonas sp.]|nr:DeoR/GlpR transcriptional regulator [Cellulomonas sp.]
MLSSTRHDTILQRVRLVGEVSVQALAADLRVSTSTIRRDLDALSQDGLLRRVRGGGSRVEPDAMGFREVSHQASAEKEAIAIRAAALVPERSVVVVDIG